MVAQFLDGDIPDAAFPSVVVVAAAVPELEVLAASVGVVVVEVVSEGVNAELDVMADDPGVVVRERLLVDDRVLSRQDSL